MRRRDLTGILLRLLHEPPHERNGHCHSPLFPVIPDFQNIKCSNFAIEGRHPPTVFRGFHASNQAGRHDNSVDFLCRLHAAQVGHWHISRTFFIGPILLLEGLSAQPRSWSRQPMDEMTRRPSARFQNCLKTPSYAQLLSLGSPISRQRLEPTARTLGQLESCSDCFNLPPSCLLQPLAKSSSSAS